MQITHLSDPELRALARDRDAFVRGVEAAARAAATGAFDTRGSARAAIEEFASKAREATHHG